MYSKLSRIISVMLVLIISLLSMAGCRDNVQTPEPDTNTDTSSVVKEDGVIDFERLGLWDYNDLSDYLESETKSGKFFFSTEEGEYIKLFSDDTFSSVITDYKTLLTHEMMVQKFDKSGKVIATYRFPDAPESSIENSSDISSIDPAQKITLTVWGDLNDRTLKEAVDEYNKTSPAYQVKIVSAPDGNVLGKLKSTKAKGENPDIVCLDSTDILLGANQGLVADLSSFGVAQNESLFTPVAFDAMRNGSAVYGLPLYAETTCLAYNLDIFKFSKIEDAPETYDELLEDAKRITETYSDKNAPIGLFETKDKNAVADTFISWLYRCGGTLLSNDNKSAEFDSAMGERALTLIADLYKQNLASDKWTSQEFYSGKTTIYEVSSSRYNGTFGGGAKANFEAAELPSITSGYNPTTCKVSGYAAVKQEDIQKMMGAYDFIVYYCTDKQYQINYATRNSKIPCHKKAQNDNAFDNDNMEVFIDTLEDAKCTPSFGGSDIIKEYIADAVLSVISGNVSVKDALSKAAQKTDARLSRN